MSSIATIVQADSAKTQLRTPLHLLKILQASDNQAGGCKERPALHIEHQPEEAIMAVKIFIKRKINKDALKDAPAMLIQARKNAMSNKGYISTETLVNCDDPCEIVVVSMWQKKEDWDTYARSTERQENEKKFAPLLGAATDYQIYNMGM